MRIADVDHVTHPAPEILAPERECKPLPVLSAEEFLAGNGVDRPWPIGYAFAGPVTDAHKQELERTYSALAAQGCRFTRVYVGDYRTGLLFDRKGQVSGVESEFLDDFDQLAEVANRHGVTVMFSLTDNAMVNGRRSESIAFIREGEASESFVNHVLVEFVKKLKDRQVIWDNFNEPENVTTVPLRDIHACGRPVVPEIDYRDICSGLVSEESRQAIRRTGCAIVRGVFPVSVASDWFAELGAYLEANHYEQCEVEKRSLDQYFGTGLRQEPRLSSAAEGGVSRRPLGTRLRRHGLRGRFPRSRHGAGSDRARPAADGVLRANAPAATRQMGLVDRSAK